MKRTLGLCLGGGGSRGVAHIGFLQALYEEEIYPDYIAGCSMGSIVGAAYAAGITPLDLKRMVVDLKLKDLASLNFHSLKSLGLFRTNRVKELIISKMGDITFDQLKIPFRCNAVDLMSGKVVTFSEGSVVDAIMASSTIPSVFEPTFKDNMVLVDGGVLDRMPAKTVKEMGADVVVAVDPLANLQCDEVPSNLIMMVLRMFDVQDMNNTARLHAERDFIDLWLEPKLGGMNQYAVRDLEFAYDKGYELGVENVKKIQRLLRPVVGRKS
ncbi:MAG: patatin-like phospholipase family protein [Christensenellaceae bacterium]